MLCSVADSASLAVGPVNAKGLTLLPKSVTTADLTGVITYRDDKAGLDALGKVFSQFLQGVRRVCSAEWREADSVPSHQVNTSLTVTGVSVTSPAQPDSPVGWLSAAFKQFTFQVVLPGCAAHSRSAVVSP